MPESKPKTAQDVYEIICGLNTEERQELMAMLEQNQDDGWASPEIKLAWVDEVERRVQLLDSGQMKTVPAEEALSEAHRRIANLQK